MVFFLSISSIFVSTSGQALPTCHGVEVLYTLIGNALQIYPNETLPENQVYRFEANITLTNKGYSTLDTWGVGLTFQHREVSNLWSFISRPPFKFPNSRLSNFFGF